MLTRNIIAMVWGGLIGRLTFAIGPLSSLSPNPIISAIQIILMSLILPGIIGGAVISGNIHAFYLELGAGVNALIHFGISWLLVSLLIRFRGRRGRNESSG